MQQLADSREREGKKIGARWAADEAEPLMLENLKELKESLRFERFDFRDWFEDNASSRGSAERLFSIICPEHDDAERASEMFWQSVLGTEDNRLAKKAPFLYGLVEGALEV